MHVLRKLSTVALVVAVAACGDSTGPGGLTDGEKQALVTALASTEFGGLAAIVVQEVGEVGSLSAVAANAARSQAIDKAIRMGVASALATEYEGAVGIAFEFTVHQGTTTTTGWFYGVVGWQGINTSTNTVDELVLVGGFGETGILPGSVTGTVESGDVFALYRASGTTYSGTTGQASVTGSSFSGSGRDCSASGTGFTYDCNVVIGSMNGDFDFDAMSTSEQTYTQTPVGFTSLPAIKMTLDITYSGGQ